MQQDVSIPKRVLEVLKQREIKKLQEKKHVSIPKRVLEVLKLLIAVDCEMSAITVSIPKRVLEVLKLTVRLSAIDNPFSFNP